MFPPTPEKNQKISLISSFILRAKTSLELGFAKQTCISKAARS